MDCWTSIFFFFTKLVFTFQLDQNQFRDKVLQKVLSLSLTHASLELFYGSWGSMNYLQAGYRDREFFSDDRHSLSEKPHLEYEL